MNVLGVEGAIVLGGGADTPIIQNIARAHDHCTILPKGFQAAKET
jgi:hypothetical protein